MVVYADVIFFVNFAFNAEILLILCKIYSKKIPVARLFISAFLGGLAGVFAFIPYFEILSRSPGRFILPIFMICIVFKNINVKGITEKYISFVAISFVMSGAINFFGLGVYAGLLIPGLIYLLICILRKNIKKQKGKVILEYGEKRIYTEGFFDSGNMLMSGGLPVILGNKSIFNQLLDYDIADDNILNVSEKFNMRIIPYVSLGKSGTVMGIELKCIWVDGKKYEKVVLAFAGNRFSDDLILNSIMI